MKSSKVNFFKYRIYQFEKRLLDIMASFLGLILLSPLFAVVALSVKLEESSSIFFTQYRLGHEGSYFKMYKFRSMKINADEELRNNKKLYQKYINNGYKLETNEDPRITKIGKKLRKTSLDEIPQLFNVLKGEMSLVGPRPIIPEELEEYKKENRVSEFLSMKPGITGIWAISGRSEVNYPERVYLEIKYRDNHSIVYDLKVIFKTFFKTLTKEGAY